MDRVRLVGVVDHVEGAEAVEHELEGLRLTVARVLALDVEGPARRVQRVGVGGLVVDSDEPLLILAVADRAGHVQLALAAVDLADPRGHVDQRRQRFGTERPVQRGIDPELRCQLAHPGIDRVSVRPAVGELDQRPVVESRLDVVRGREHLRVGLRMEDLLLGRLLPLQLREPLELGTVVAVEVHDPLGGEDSPEIGRAVVAERSEQLPRLPVHQRRGVEEELRVARIVDRRLLAIGRDHVLEVADPHVVARRREVGAAEAIGGDLEVLPHSVERRLGVEALVDLGPALAQRLLLLGQMPQLHQRPRADLRLLAARLALRLRRLCLDPRDPLRQRAAPGEIDPHPEQVGPGARDDLGEPARRLGVVPGDHLRPAGALEQDHRLHHVRIGAVCGRRLLDLIAPARRPAGAGDDPAGALLVEDVREPERRPPLEVTGPIHVPRERIPGAAGAPGLRDPACVEAVAADGAGEKQNRDHDRSRDRGNRCKRPRARR